MSSTWWKDPAELVGEQGSILDLPAHESLLINGPPGSGKTNLLLLRANYLYLGELPNLHVVVFGSVLRNFIQLGGGQYKFPQEKVITNVRLFNQILYEYGVPVDDSDMDVFQSRSKKADAILNLVDAGQIGKIYDALLLDEAQDYLPNEIRVFRSITKVLVAASDVRQKVYKGADCSSELLGSVDNVYPLQYHFRNGREICRLADAIMEGKPEHSPLVEYSNYDEAAYPSRVSVKSALSTEQQADAIVDQIVSQRLAYPNELIGVLCPRKEEVNSILEHLKGTSLAGDITHCNSAEFDPEQPVWVTTIASAKGLEFRAVHLAGLEYLARMGGAQRRLAFTGITRAKTALTLYYNNSIPGYLESGLRAIEPVKKAITKANIFGKG